MPSTQPHINIFIAYSREDVEYLKRLKTYLKPLSRIYEKLHVWYDGEIVPGEIWDKVIKEHIHNDEIVVFLISADSLASDYFYKEEAAHALERHHKDETIVIPVILKACLWRETPFAELQLLPQDGKPISQWDDEAQAYANIAQGINKNIPIAIERKQKKINQILSDGYKALDNKDFEKAGECVAAIFKIDPDNEAAKQLESEINQAIKNQHKIVQLFDDAQETLDRNDYGQALEYVEKILQLNPNHKEAQELRLEVKQAIKNQKRIAQLLADARKAFDDKNFAKAQGHIEEILEIYPNYEEAKEFLPKINQALEKQNKIEQLLENTRKALDNKDFLKAKEYVAAIFDLDPDSEKAKQLESDIKKAEDDVKKIAQLLEKAKKDFNDGNPVQAKDDIKEILQLDPNHKEANELRLEINRIIKKQNRIAGLLAYARKEFDNKNFITAKEYVDKILKENPNHEEANELLPKINKALEKQNKIEQLLADGHKALENEAFEEAEKCVAAIFDLDSDSEKAKQLQSKINTAKKIAQLLKDARAALDRKDYEQAKIHARAVLKLAPDNEEAKDIIRQCKKEQRGVIFEDLKNPFLIAALVATLVNIYLVYKVLQKHHQEYQSKCVSGNCKNGEGRLEYEDGRVYDGEWKDGKFHGQGIFIYQSDTIYDGQWKNNIMNGDGIRYYENGAVYDGNWINGIREGRGIFTIPDIGEYNGAFENDMFNGDGIFIYLDGTIYDGQWRNNRKHGQE